MGPHGRPGDVPPPLRPAQVASGDLAGRPEQISAGRGSGRCRRAVVQPGIPDDHAITQGDRDQPVVDRVDLCLSDASRAPAGTPEASRSRSADSHATAARRHRRPPWPPTSGRGARTTSRTGAAVRAFLRDQLLHGPARQAVEGHDPVVPQLGRPRGQSPVAEDHPGPIRRAERHLVPGAQIQEGRAAPGPVLAPDDSDRRVVRTSLS